MALVKGLSRRWIAYWHRPGFELSYAVGRLAILLSCVMSMPGAVLSDYSHWMSGQDYAQYRPVGILQVFGDSPPSPAYFDSCRIILRAAMVCAAVGLLTRISLIAAAWCFLSLTSVIYSFLTEWSHGFAPQGMLLLVLAFGPRHTFTLDHWICSKLHWRRSFPQSASSAVLLCQFAVAWVFANAALYKIYLGNKRLLRWALSDNLRNTVIKQYWVIGEEMPDTLRYIVEHAWAYKSLACLNIIAQLLPLAAMFVTQRPWLRAICGTMMVVEVAGLDYVMGLPNPHWYPLIALFIDWDRLGRKLGLLRAQGSPVAADGWRGRLLNILIASFCLFFLWVSLTHFPKARRYSYPFTAYSMYSTLNIARGKSSHQPLPLIGTTWKVESTPRLEQWQTRWLFRNYYNANFASSVSPNQQTRAVATLIETQWGVKVQRITSRVTLFEVPAYPERAETREVTSTVWAIVEGTYEWAVEYDVGPNPNDLNSHWIQPRAIGYRDPQFEIEAIRIESSEITRLTGKWIGNQFHFTLNQTGFYHVRIVVKESDGSGESIAFAGPLIVRQ